MEEMEEEVGWEEEAVVGVEIFQASLVGEEEYRLSQELGVLDGGPSASYSPQALGQGDQAEARIREAEEAVRVQSHVTCLISCPSQAWMKSAQWTCGESTLKGVVGRESTVYVPTNVIA